MNQSLLFDMLGILIGFAGIMLSLSLMVTALTQCVIHFWNLREKNLQNGLDRFLERINKGGMDLSRNDDELLNNKKISWITIQEIESILKNAQKINNKIPEQLNVWFTRMEKEMSKRFQKYSRYIALGSALFVAFIFQVSAPEIYMRLSTDPQYRIEATLMTEELLNKYEVEFSLMANYQEVSATALDKLQDSHPKLLDIEQISGIGKTKEEMLEELDLVFEEHPEKEDLLTEYELILDDLHSEGYEQARQVAENNRNRLALVDITPWAKGWGYYKSIPNVIGVLMTAILIALGAPFWFNTMKNLMSLRDALSPEKNQTKKERNR